MTNPIGSSELSDAREREGAASTFDRNVVVTAGAGTGKTTLVVDRLVHLLMRHPGPLRITEVVALTFTNKAANEMKLRLRGRLQSYLAVRLDLDPGNEKEEKLQREIRSLMDRYHLTKNEIDSRAREALRNIERSEIGTIHSFAAALLRLYPMESRIDPQFREDDGAQFERSFEERWALWLDQELSVLGARKDDWKKVLRKVGLQEITELAFSLCSEGVQLDPLAKLSGKKEIPAPIREWLSIFKQKASLLLERHPEERVNENLVRASLRVIQDFLEASGKSTNDLKEERSILLSGKTINKNTKGWSEEDLDPAQELVRVAKGLCQVDSALTSLLCDLLVPYAEGFREAFTREGFVSFDGLLVRARNLVRDHLRVREELKRQFKAILIDEFQDTDPIQYEILLYLAEEIGHQAKDWSKVKLTPGKIFVVGDPKQSIYAFRRADIEAYLGVVEKIITAQNGMECHLTTNFRSHAGILDVVNTVFNHLIRPREGIQPAYVAIQPASSNGADAPASQGPLPFRKVAIRRISPEQGDADAELARRLEAEHLARWLAEEILGRAEVLNRDGERVIVQPKDVAILFRKLTDVHQYLEPLRRWRIRYVVEGERHFYAVQEIVDAVNVLRTVENPFDRLALVGVLRSPLGGLKDHEIYELHRRELLDYRAAKRLTEKKFSPVKEIYEALYGLHQETQRLPVGEGVSRIFGRLPIRLLAACSFHGEQAVSNLEKLRQQAELMGREGLVTLKEVIGRLQRRVLDVKEEGESVLAEENIDAVRILSIHKAKGLEFPVVILAGCHMSPDQRRGDRAEALHDWSSGLAGVRVGQYWSLPGLYLADKTRPREEEEQKRVLYVAMTRAREHLTLSCAPTARRPGGSFLSMLDEALKEKISSSEESAAISAGSGTIDLRIVREKLRPPGGRQNEQKDAKPRTSWKPFVQLWKRRTEAYEAAMQRPLFLTPTSLKRREEELAEGVTGKALRDLGDARPMLIGELAHRFLRDWDFTKGTESFRDDLNALLRKWIESVSDPDSGQIQRELEEIFGSFFSSAAYRELSSSRILGREVPFLIPWDGQIMEGVMDVLYEREGLLYLADYKTDRVEKRGLAEAAERYRHQVRIYSEAARRSLQRDVAGFDLIFLRLGEALRVA